MWYIYIVRKKHRNERTGQKMNEICKREQRELKNLASDLCVSNEVVAYAICHEATYQAAHKVIMSEYDKKWGRKIKRSAIGYADGHIAGAVKFVS